MKFFALLTLALCLNVFAHDEGHGPKLKDSPKRGGRISSVVLAKEASLGAKAALIYKAEIIRVKSAGKVMVYYYDSQMQPLKLDNFSSTASGVLISGKAGKEKEQEFELKLVKDHYEGVPPKPTSRRYNIDVRLKEGEKELLAAFDNLD